MVQNVFGRRVVAGLLGRVVVVVAAIEINNEQFQSLTALYFAHVATIK